MCAGPLSPFKIELEVTSRYLAYNHAVLAMHVRRAALESQKAEMAAKDWKRIDFERTWRQDLALVMGEITQIP